MGKNEFIYEEWMEGYAIHAVKKGVLIRCKDCMWYEVDKLKADGTADMRYSPSFCIYWRTHTNKDDYCSNGKKAEYGTGND